MGQVRRSEKCEGTEIEKQADVSLNYVNKEEAPSDNDNFTMTSILNDVWKKGCIVAGIRCVYIISNKYKSLLLSVLAEVYQTWR